MTIEKAIRMLVNTYEKASKLEYVRKPVSYALYKTWKAVNKVEAENDGKRP